MTISDQRMKLPVLNERAGSIHQLSKKKNYFVELLAVTLLIKYILLLHNEEMIIHSTLYDTKFMISWMLKEMKQRKIVNSITNMSF